MKPSFALNITDSTIGLLHRTARGWLQVGETAFDTADLAEALGYLRGSALGLSPGGLTTKLVLPNSQIKYLLLDAPGPDEADRRSQIRAALVGRTPYNVEDLVFDWSGTGPKVQVAVVARETLDEAEAFATEHRFNPVSFVGLPEKADFAGEPWFGPSKLSATLLEKGEKVDRDQDPVSVAARDLPKSHPGAAKSQADAVSPVDDEAAKAPLDAERPTRAQRRAAAAAAAAEQAHAAAGADTLLPVDAVDPAATPAPDRQPDAPLQAQVADAFPESRDDIAAAAVVWPEVEPTPALPAEAAVEPTPVYVTDNQAFPEVAAQAPLDDLAASDDLPPAPSAAIMAAFASRRAGDLPNGKRVGGPSSDPAAPRAPSLGGSDLADRMGAKSAPPPLSRPKVGGDSQPFGAASRADAAGDSAVSDIETVMAKHGGAKASTTAFVTAPNIPGSRKRKSLPAGAVAAPGAPDARKSLTKPGGTFASSKERGKPRFLGLILTALLLLFLALIAAWSSFFMASNDTQSGTAIVTAPQPADTPEQAATDVPAVDDEMLADSQDPADFDASAAVDPAADVAGNVDAVAAVDPAADLAANVVPDATVAEGGTATLSTANADAGASLPAPVDVAGTEIQNVAPLSDTQDEIFLAAIDAPPLALDPLALPQPAPTNDALPLPQLEPPPFGTVYQFDADGRIRPTPEGIITPEGVRLVAGKPSVIPPPRPEGLSAAVASAAAPATASALAATLPTTVATTPFPSDPALAEARPRARPAGLVLPVSEQADDDALLAEPGTSRVSSLRPLARPPAVLAAGEAARLSTAAASLAAQTDQAAAVEAAVQASFQPDANASPLAVAVSRKPAPRPKDMTSAVEAAVALAVRTPEPQVEEAHVEADAEPEIASVAPAIPTRASVAKQATYVNAINLSKINLIGVYGTQSSRYALIRQANGRYKKVKVGDALDGGKVASIDSDELRYQKSGRMVSLKLPKT